MHRIFWAGQFRSTDRVVPPSAEPLRRKESLSQQTLAELMAVPQQVYLSIGAGTTEIAPRFVRLVRDPHRGQIAAAQQAGKGQRGRAPTGRYWDNQWDKVSRD